MTKEQRNQWLIDNLKFVYTVCKKWRHMPDYEDILQVGCEATLKALIRVTDGADDKAIRGYVGKYIEGYVIRYLDYNKHKVHVPYQLINEVNVLVDSINYEFSDGEGKTKTYEEMYLFVEEQGYDEAEIMVQIEKLKPSYRNVADMLIEGYSMPEIAKVKNCTFQNIHQKVVNIRKAVRVA